MFQFEKIFFFFFYIKLMILRGKMSCNGLSRDNVITRYERCCRVRSEMLRRVIITLSEIKSCVVDDDAAVKVTVHRDE